MKSLLIEISLKQIEERLDKAFRKLNDITNKINQVREEMDNAGIPDYRYENSK